MSDASHGERLRLSSALSARARRDWTRRLGAAQEAVEQAEEARNQLFATAFAAGVPYSLIEIATGIGGQTVRNGIADAGRTEEDR